MTYNENWSEHEAHDEKFVEDLHLCGPVAVIPFKKDPNFLQYS